MNRNVSEVKKYRENNHFSLESWLTELLKIFGKKNEFISGIITVLFRATPTNEKMCVPSQALMK